MSLKLYNTEKGEKQIFEPIDPSRVTMYVCGPTVYNRVHIGNARPAVVFDVLFRLLQREYGDVAYARNITDIDDKIIKAARENGEEIDVLSARFAQAYFEDMAAINNLQPTIQPYATQHINDMLEIINTLVEKGHAYEAEGHVLFAVQTMDDYGKLSNRSLEDMLAGARVEVAPYKKYAGDFVLWKPSSDDEPGWDSPYGRGRPGWHIECSAMIKAHLGDSIDIHGGGRDLTFPHHENERAQSQCAHGNNFVNYWMHNGYINIDGEKMSKSLGNFRLVNDLLKKFAGETLRFALLSAQYRSELNFSVELLEQAKSALDGIYTALQTHADVEAIAPSKEALNAQPFYRALLDDLNTPLAISELHQLAKSLNKAEGEALQKAKGLLLACGELIGLLQDEPTAWFQTTAEGGLTADEIEGLIVKRHQAKLDKDYALSDEIRDNLKSQGVILEDSADGTTWRRA